KRATILQRESHAAHGNAGTERRVIALDERDDVAIAIDRSQINNVAGGRLSGERITIRLSRIDQLRSLGGVLFRKQALHRNLSKTRISVVTVEIDVDQLHGF